MKKGKEGKRELIIKTSKELFIERGYTVTKVEDITKKMGISKGNFYTYFNSKEEVLIEILEEIKKEYTEMLEKIDISNEPGKILEDFFISGMEMFLINFHKINPQNLIMEIMETSKIGTAQNEMKEIGIKFLMKNVVEKYNNHMYDLKFITKFIKGAMDEYLWSKIIEEKIENKENYIEKRKEEIKQLINFIHNGLLKK